MSRYICFRGKSPLKTVPPEQQSYEWVENIDASGFKEAFERYADTYLYVEIPGTVIMIVNQAEGLCETMRVRAATKKDLGPCDRASTRDNVTFTIEERS